MSGKLILAINPGSTSTKLAVFKGNEKIHATSLSHSAQELEGFATIYQQKDFRTELVLNFLNECNLDPKDMDAVVARGGLLPPLESGTYEINRDMLDFLSTTPREHGSNLGAPIAYAIAHSGRIPAYIVDPVVVDEMDDLARITGIAEIERVSILHTLNQKAAAREAAAKLGVNYDACNLVVAHLGGGISVGAHRRGKIVDTNNALNGDGPFSPERAGTIPSWQLVELALSKKYQKDELKKMITGKGGVVSLLGTNDMREVEKRIDNGDEKAAFILDAMVYNVAKLVGAMATVLKGDVDAMVITGGIAYDKRFVRKLSERIAFIGKVLVFPGEDEMRALAMGALRVLQGEEPARSWKLQK